MEGHLLRQWRRGKPGRERQPIGHDVPQHRGKEFAGRVAEMGPAFARKGFHRGAAFGDLNKDGWMDIVVTGLNERPRILLNSPDPGAHWLLLDLKGTASNRDAIGAQVTVVTAAGRRFYNHVSI